MAVPPKSIRYLNRGLSHAYRSNQMLMQDAVSTLLFLLLREQGGSRIPRPSQVVQQFNFRAKR